MIELLPVRMGFLAQSRLNSTDCPPIPCGVVARIGGGRDCLTVSNNIISIFGVFCSLLCKIDKTSEFHYRLNFQWLVKKKKARKSGSIETTTYLIEPSVHHLVMYNAKKNF